MCDHHRCVERSDSEGVGLLHDLRSCIRADQRAFPHLVDTFKQRLVGGVVTRGNEGIDRSGPPGPRRRRCARTLDLATLRKQCKGSFHECFVVELQLPGRGGEGTGR